MADVAPDFRPHRDDPLRYVDVLRLPAGDSLAAAPLLPLHAVPLVHLVSRRSGVSSCHCSPVTHSQSVTAGTVLGPGCRGSRNIDCSDRHIDIGFRCNSNASIIPVVGCSTPSPSARLAVRRVSRLAARRAAERVECLCGFPLHIGFDASAACSRDTFKPLVIVVPVDIVVDIIVGIGIGLGNASLHVRLSPVMRAGCHEPVYHAIEVQVVEVTQVEFPVVIRPVVAIGTAVQIDIVIGIVIRLGHDVVEPVIGFRTVHCALIGIGFGIVAIPVNTAIAVYAVGVCPIRFFVSLVSRDSACDIARIAQEIVLPHTIDTVPVVTRLWFPYRLPELPRFMALAPSPRPFMWLRLVIALEQ